MSEFDLPKFPEESRRYDEAMAELDRRAVENQAGVGSTADWLRQTWPALAICSSVILVAIVVGFALFEADEVIIIAFGPIPTILGISFLVLCICLARRHYRNRLK
ncbi:MAG: hypothetical protein JWO38_21 [Gemmataceae bacterium]|nr:hypothetical protein [Gemmataceae bacterium]